MSATLETRLRRLEKANAQAERTEVVVISGTAEEYEAKTAEAYASRLVTEGQLLVYIRKPIAGRDRTVTA